MALKENNSVQRFVFLNQLAKPLFRELCIDVAQHLPKPSLLSTGDHETLAKESWSPHLKIRSSPSYNRNSNWSRLFSWLSYTFDSLFVIGRAGPETAVLFASNPPIIGPFVWLLSKLKGFPYIVLVYDLYPEVLINFGVLRKNSYLARLWRKCNVLVWESASMVVTLGGKMADRLTSQFDAGCTELGQVAVLPPWADTDVIRPLSKSENSLAEEMGQLDATTVLYSGNLGISHDIDSILEACRLLRSRRDIKFLLIGGGEKWEDVVSFQALHQLEGLSVFPYQAEERLPYSLALGDISLVTLAEGAEGLMFPSKMSYYMAAGSAVLGVCRDNNDLKETIEHADCGVCVPPNRPDLLAETIVRLVDRPALLRQYRANAIKYAKSTYSRKACMQNLKKMLQKTGYVPLS